MTYTPMLTEEILLERINELENELVKTRIKQRKAEEHIKYYKNLCIKLGAKVSMFRGVLNSLPLNDFGKEKEDE